MLGDYIGSCLQTPTPPQSAPNTHPATQGNATVKVSTYRRAVWAPTQDNRALPTPLILFHAFLPAAHRLVLLVFFCPTPCPNPVCPSVLVSGPQHVVSRDPCVPHPPNPRLLLRSNPHLPPRDPQRGAPSTRTSSNHVHPLHLSVADVFTVRLLRWTQWGLEPRAPRVQLCCTKMLKKSLVNEQAY